MTLCTSILWNSTHIKFGLKRFKHIVIFKKPQYGDFLVKKKWMERKPCGIQSWWTNKDVQLRIIWWVVDIYIHLLLLLTKEMFNILMHLMKCNTNLMLGRYHQLCCWGPLPLLGLIPYLFCRNHYQGLHLGLREFNAHVQTGMLCHSSHMSFLDFMIIIVSVTSGMPNNYFQTFIASTQTLKYKPRYTSRTKIVFCL